jgi:electron transport complex protein RnfG
MSDADNAADIPRSDGLPLAARPSTLRVSSHSAIILLLFTLAFTTLMAATYFSTKADIDASARAEKMKLIEDVLPKSYYDNDLLADKITLSPIPALGLGDESTVFRARKNGQPVALVVEAAALDGYSGRISLLLAVKVDGELIALRVTDHKETPGLGDYIDPKKDKNKHAPWINQFSDRKLDGIGQDQWRVKKDGGVFDARAGATISARAVTNASRNALLWIIPRREQLFALATGAKFKEP